VDQLRALVIEKDGIIATQNETIHHREDQINESDATITQRNTIIEFLQEQIHDLILEVDDANAHINELQQQPVPPAVRPLKKKRKILRKLRESPRLTLSTETLSLAPTIPLRVVSH
jgi:chromosome segregation ATPase